jgi:hypothetical protein
MDKRINVLYFHVAVMVLRSVLSFSSDFRWYRWLLRYCQSRMGSRSGTYLAPRFTSAMLVAFRPNLRGMLAPHHAMRGLIKLVT